MKRVLRIFALLIVFSASLFCGKEEKPQKKIIPLEKRIIGNWIVTGFICDRMGKCRKTVTSGKAGMTLKDDGTFYEDEQISMKYRIEGNTVLIHSDKKYLKRKLSFSIARIDKDEMIVLWSYNENDDVYTRYRRAP